MAIYVVTTTGTTRSNSSIIASAVTTTTTTAATRFRSYCYLRTFILRIESYRLVILSLLLYSTPLASSYLSQRPQRGRIRYRSTNRPIDASRRLSFHPNDDCYYVQRPSSHANALSKYSREYNVDNRTQPPYIINNNGADENSYDEDVTSLKYLRWHTTSADNDNNRMELQTRVTTFQRYLSVAESPATDQGSAPSKSSSSSSLSPMRQGIRQTIQLHGQFHFADTEEYYRYYTSDPHFINDVDSVFYELIVDESLLQYEMSDRMHDGRDTDAADSNRAITPSTTSAALSGETKKTIQKRKLKSSTVLQASVSDETVARRYNWYSQVNCMDYSNGGSNNDTHTNWYHADFTRQEFLHQLQNNQQQSSSTVSNCDNHKKNTSVIGSKDNDRRPLWQQAQNKGNRRNNNNGAVLLLDATTALLVGPPLIVQQQQSQKSTGLFSQSLSSLSSIRRRIFTNLFLPGDTVAVWLRCILWITIPSPELSILLIDWSSTWGSVTTTAQNSGIPLSSFSTNKSQISPIAIPLLQALSRGRFNDVRRIVFGQVAVSGHQQATVAISSIPRNESGDNSLLISKRNDHALQQVFTEFEQQQHSMNMNQNYNDSCTLALLYGCNHCPDLHMKLTNKGFHPLESQWRTAWSVGTVPLVTREFERGDNQNSTNGISFLVLFLLPLYFCIGGYDWMETIVDSARALENTDGVGSALTIVLFYVARHVLLYLSLSKFVIDGDNNNVISST